MKHIEVIATWIQETQKMTPYDKEI